MKPIVAMVLFVGCAALAGETPSIAHRSVDGRPVWIAAGAALDDEGRLRSEFFSERVRNRFARIAARNRNGCEVYAGTGPLEIFERMDSLDALARHSKTIVAGTAVEATQGFYADNPGTLYAIEVDDVVKSPRVAERGQVFLFIPHARIETRDGAICAMPPKGTAIPAVGDRLLFFAYLDPLDAAGEIHVVEPHQQLVVQTKSRVALPPAVRSSGAVPPRDLAEVISRVRATLADRGGRPKQ